MAVNSLNLPCFKWELLALLLCVACSRGEPVRHTSASAEANASAPASLVALPTLTEVSGTELLVRVRASHQKAVLVNAFASWCEPCREELPLLGGMAKALADQGVALWLVSMDDPETRPAAAELLAELGLTVPAFAARPPLADFKPALNPRWPGMIPASFLFDAGGKLRYFWAGEAYPREIQPIIDGFLAGRPIDGEAHFGLAPGATSE
ncbi:MAG TPA: TlpA disulfide reductase family protein [Polyangiaceae bacterium]